MFYDYGPVAMVNGVWRRRKLRISRRAKIERGFCTHRRMKDARRKGQIGGGWPRDARVFMR
jgi:hypothetical protein